jgi:3-oxoadipate enol-lactonase
MNVIDRGSGPALVLIPGVQGRWQYHKPAIESLVRHFRVITFPLCGEPDADRTFDPVRGLDNYNDQIDSALDAAQLDRAMVCGISFGGVPAIHYAATRRARCSALVLVSTPRPGLHLRRKHRIFVRMPWLFGPIFIAAAPWRMRHEVQRALPTWRARAALGVRQMKTFITAPPTLSQMAARAELLASTDLSAECRAITAPTLIVTGEAGLDHVVPVDGTSEYARLIRGSRSVVLEQTGHIGANTRSEQFADLIRRFADEHGHAAA